MKLRKNWKRFWTLDRHHAGGFTLVELIVVIAILAILGGVAVPAYSGYVQKAERANDDALLDEINTAFASACMINGESNIGRNDVDAKIIDKAFVYTAPFKSEFEGFYEGSEFKTTTSIGYNPLLGMFEYGANVVVGGQQIFVNQELADAMKNNTFSDIGAELLTSKVSKVSNIASLLIGMYDDAGNPSTFTQLVFDEDGVYLSNLQKTLGMDDATFMAFVMDEEGNFKNDILANSLVLTAAQKTEGMDTSFLGTTGSAAQLRSELDNPATATDAMAKLALTYGMYTSYVQNNPDMTDRSEELLEQGTFSGMTDILKDIESDGFNKYLQSEQGKADLDAYLASMQIVNNSANQSVDATKDILTSGFNDPDLVAALNGLMNPSGSN